MYTYIYKYIYIVRRFSKQVTVVLYHRRTINHQYITIMTKQTLVYCTKQNKLIDNSSN